MSSHDTDDRLRAEQLAVERPDTAVFHDYGGGTWELIGGDGQCRQLVRGTATTASSPGHTETEHGGFGPKHNERPGRCRTLRLSHVTN